MERDDICFPRNFEFNSDTLIEIRYFSGCYLLPTKLHFLYLQIILLVETASNVGPFSLKPPLLRSSFLQSYSGWLFFCGTINVVNIIVDNIVNFYGFFGNIEDISRNVPSAWLPLDFMPYVKIFIIFSWDIFSWSKCLSNMYLWRQQYLSFPLTVLHIFLTSMCMVTWCVFHRMSVSTNSCMFLQPFRNILFGLYWLALGWNSSNTI